MNESPRIHYLECALKAIIARHEGASKDPLLVNLFGGEKFPNARDDMVRIAEEALGTGVGGTVNPSLT